MMRSFTPTSRVRLGARVAANNAPQAAPYTTTSSPYGPPAQQAQQPRPQGSAPQPPAIRQAAQSPAQGNVGRLDGGAPIQAPALPRTAFAPNFGRQPERPPQAPVQPQQGWSASNDQQDPVWRNTWQATGEGLWGQNAQATSGGYPIPDAMTPANIDKSRLELPRDIGLQRAGRPAVQYTPPAEVEPMQDGIPTGSDVQQSGLGSGGLGYGGAGPAGSPPPPAGDGIGVQRSGLYSSSDEDREGWSEEEIAAAEAAQAAGQGDEANRSERYKDVTDDELARMIEEEGQKLIQGAATGYDDTEYNAMLTEQRRREAAGSASEAPGPSDEYIDTASKGSGVPPEQIKQDYEDGYRWSQDENGEWKRYNYEEMLDAFLTMYDPEDGNPYMNAIWEDLQAGRAPSQEDIALAMQEYDDDSDLDAWRRFRGETKAEIEERGGYGQGGGSPSDEEDSMSPEMRALYDQLMADMQEPWEPFDESATRAASALDRSQQMRSALELAGAQGASSGQVQSAVSDIGLRSETALNAEVADRNMASQIAKSQRNMGLMAQASQILLAQQAAGLSAEEAALNRDLQMRLARMQISQQQRMDAIQAERERNRTFWDSLGGVFGGLLGLGGTLGGAYLGRPSYPDFRLP